jgi:nicotinamide mononucleotide transporter
MITTVHIPLGPLGDPAFTAFGSPTTWGEAIAFVTGAVCVWLVARQNAWNWPVGIVNTMFFLALFWNYGLYADSCLQALYIALNGYGWWAWLRGGTRHTSLRLSRTMPSQWMLIAGFLVFATASLTLVLDRNTDSTVPFADAFTTALSLTATWGQTRKKIECWWIWITADLIYIPLYAHKDLWLTSMLYVLFLGLCVMGLRNWRREFGAVPARVSVAA